MRFHGPSARKYTGSYTDNQLRQWIDTIRPLLTDRTQVFAYFNNDIGGHAIRNARSLRTLIATLPKRFLPVAS